MLVLLDIQLLLTLFNVSGPCFMILVINGKLEERNFYSKKMSKFTLIDQWPPKLLWTCFAFCERTAALHVGFAAETMRPLFCCWQCFFFHSTSKGWSCGLFLNVKESKQMNSSLWTRSRHRLTYHCHFFNDFSWLIWKRIDGLDLTFKQVCHGDKRNVINYSKPSQNRISTYRKCLSRGV